MSEQFLNFKTGTTTLRKIGNSKFLNTTLILENLTKDGIRFRVSDFTDKVNIFYSDPSQDVIKPRGKYELNISSYLSSLALEEKNTSEMMLEAVTTDFDNEDASIGTEQLFTINISCVPQKIYENLYRINFKFEIEGEGVTTNTLENSSEIEVIEEKSAIKETPKPQEEEEIFEEIISSNKKKEHLPKGDDDESVIVEPGYVDEVDFEAEEEEHPLIKNKKVLNEDFEIMDETKEQVKETTPKKETIPT